MKTQENQQNWRTAGQGGAKNLLNNFLSENLINNIPHAFLFLGPAGVGKYQLAKEFGDKIRSIGITGEGKNGSEIFEYDFADSSSVEDLRELIGLSSLTSGLQNRKIFILKNFDQASTASSNILLKTLEEPSASSMFLLVANSNRVLPTVMSRCIAIRCFPVVDSQTDSSLPKNLSSIAVQYPGLLIDLENDLEKAQVLSGLMQKLQDNKLSLINLSTLVDLESEDLQLFIRLWIHSLKQNLSKAGVNLSKTIHNLKIAQNTNEDLKRSYNTKLVLQQFLIQTK